MQPLGDDLIVKCVSEIHDPVTTTDELIPSGETSSFRSNPLGLAEFTLSRKDPEYVGKAKEVRALELARELRHSIVDSIGPDYSAESSLTAEYENVLWKIKEINPDFDEKSTSIGSTIYANKPGDGSAREQAASCQKVLGAWANIAKEYATKRYRSNLINWGMLPFLYDGDDIKKDAYIYIPNIRKAVAEKAEKITAYVLGEKISEVVFTLGDLSDDERQIILDGCLINFYRH